MEPTLRDVELLEHFSRQAESFAEEVFHSEGSEYPDEVYELMRYISDSPWKAYDYVPREGPEILDNIETATLDQVRHLVTGLWRSEIAMTGSWAGHLIGSFFSIAASRARELLYESSIHDQVLQLACRLQEFETVSDFPISNPTFDRGWLAHAEGVLTNLSSFPPTFCRFVEDVGAVQAIDVAGGLAFFSAEQIVCHLAQDYGPQLAAVDDVPTFPFAANSSGEYLLLAYDDSGVWKICPQLPRLPAPHQLSGGFGSFLELIVEDWQAMLDGKGAPYRAS